jgi:hypothetical protein
VGEDPIQKPELTKEDGTRLLEMVSGPSHVFVTHPTAFEYFPGLTGKLVKFAQSAGYREEALAEISDSNGRQVFEVFRFVPQAVPLAAERAGPSPAGRSHW